LLTRAPPAAPGPPEKVNIAVWLRLTRVERHARHGGGDVLDAVAVEVRDSPRRRNELDLRRQRRGRTARESSIPVPLEDCHIVAVDILSVDLPETAYDDIKDVVPGDVGQ